MASIKYQVFSNSKMASIYLYLSLGRNKANPRVKIGLSINSDNWSKTKGLPKQTTPQNKNLSEDLQSLKSFVFSELNKANANGVEVDKEWLKHKIDIHFKRISDKEVSENLIDCIDFIIDNASTRKNAKGGVGLSKSRVNSYKSLKALLKEFKPKTKIKVKQVNIELANSFLDFLLNERNYSESYAVKKIADLKTVCYNASIQGVEVSPQLRGVSAVKPKKDLPIYLNHKELEKIEKLNLTDDRLINVRKFLLLGCNIGQRGSDLLNITKDNIKNFDGFEVIEVKQTKTDKIVLIPISNKLKEILKDGLPKKISIQKFNVYLKELCKLAGIDEKIESSKIEVIVKGKGNKEKRKVKSILPKYEFISSHVCRRSFATNNYGVLPTSMIMQVTGHTKESTFLGYIGKTSLDYAKQMVELLNKTSR